MGAFFNSFDWPHSLLLGGAILGGVIVGIGILMESEKWSLAAILVLTGIVIEPVFTIGLFVYDEYLARGQNDEIIALRKNSISRSIDVAAFSERLQGAPPAKVEIRYVVACTDCESLSFWLSEGLKRADWSVGPAIPISPEDRDWVRAVLSLHAQSSGVTVVIDSPDKITANPKSSLGALNGALQQALGFNLSGYDANTTGGVDVTMPPGLIRIVVAPKP